MSITIVERSLLPLALACAFALNSAAQDAPQSSKPDAAPQSAPGDSKQSSKPQPGTPSQSSSAGTSTDAKQEGTSKDRLFYALPNFLTLENAGNVPPLTTAQKFSVVARGSFDYVQFPWYGFLSGISQWEDSEPGFGQGAAGYGKRFAASFADGTIENFLTGAVLPSLLRQDPRFFQSGKGSFGRRTGYAISRIFVTRTDSGGTQFNYSEIVGSALSAAISTYSYHPRSKVVTTPTGLRFIPSDRTLKNTASVWGSQVGYDTLTIVVKEFWPDIHRKLSKKKKAEAPQAGTSPQ